MPLTPEQYMALSQAASTDFNETDKSAQARVKKNDRDKLSFSDAEYDAYWLSELANLPRLSIPSTNSSEFIQEHIPSLNNKWWDKLLMKYLLLRMKYNRPIYYWHTRFMKSPYERKRYDLMFAAHVLCEHDGLPEDKTELRHYKWLKQRYGAELDYFTPVFERNKEGKHAYWDTYAQAYVDMWIRPIYPELKMLFHGMTAEDFLDYREYESYHLKKEIKKKIASNAAKHRWLKIKNK